MSSLQARLLLAVGALALSGVFAVAIVARQGARQEFLRFRSMEQGAAQSATPELSRRIAHELDGRCCAAAALDGAAALVGPRTAILVTDVAAGRLVASAGRSLAGFDHLAMRRDGDAIVFDARRVGPGGTREFVLTLALAGTPLRLDEGTPAVRGAVARSPVGPTAETNDAVGDWAVVEVANTGSRLAPDDLARVFDRFYRADPSRARGTGGTGLGLAIVRHLVEAQGGSVWAKSDDAGVTVGFALPLPPLS